MSTLANTESRFQSFVVGGDSSIADEIRAPDEHTLNVRIGIYYDAYRSRLVEVLGNDFEVTRALLGEDVFDAIARDYIDAHPSRFRNVRWFGERMADFMLGHPPYRKHIVACELARFEWTLGLAFDATDRCTITFEDLAGVSPDDWVNLQFVTHPSLHLLELYTNAPELWSQLKDHGKLGEGTTLEQPMTYAIWRRDETPRYRPMSADELWAINAVRSGATFGELCEGLSNFLNQDEAPMRAATLTHEWVHAQWITEFRTQA